MFDLEENTEYEAATDIVEAMLTYGIRNCGGIMLERDCDDLRPLLMNVIEENDYMIDGYVSIACYIIIYVGRETNNWREYLTEKNLDDFFSNGEVEETQLSLLTLADRLGKREEQAMEEFYSFMSEQFISNYEP